MSRTYQVVFAVSSRRTAPTGFVIKSGLQNKTLGVGENITIIKTLTYFDEGYQQQFNIYTCNVTWEYTDMMFAGILSFHDYELHVVTNSADKGYDHVKERYDLAKVEYPYSGQTQSFYLVLKRPENPAVVLPVGSQYECMTMFI